MKFSPNRKAEFLLANAVDARDYASAVRAVRRMGLDPARIPHWKPRGTRCGVARPILSAAIHVGATHLFTGDFRDFEGYYGRRRGGVLVLAPRRLPSQPREALDCPCPGRSLSSRGCMRLLWVTPYFPRRGVSAARERFWHLLARLARRHEITLVTLVDAEDSDFYGELPPGLAAVEPVARTGFAPDDPLALLPRMVRWVGFAEPALEAAVAARLAAGRYDLVQYEFIEMGVLMPAPRIPTILTVHQLGFAFAGPEWRAEGRGLRRGAVALFRHLRDLDFELRAVLRAHHVITMSPEDAARLQRFLPDLPISVSPVGVDSTAFRPPARPLPCDSDILFVGHFSHLANRDAVAFLAHEVLPLLGRSVRVRLVGRAVTPEVAALARPEAVEVVGEVPDVRPYLARAAVVVAPVRFGTGMRGKVLEALAMGRPVVTTALGGEGLGATPGHHLLVADSAQDFAAALRRLLNDPDHAARLGANGRALVEARFDWNRIAADHDTIYQEVLERARPAPDTLRDRSISMPRRLGRRPALAVGAGLVAWRGLGWYARRATAG